MLMWCDGGSLGVRVGPRIGSKSSVLTLGEGRTLVGAQSGVSRVSALSWLVSGEVGKELLAPERGSLREPPVSLRSGHQGSFPASACLLTSMKQRRSAKRWVVGGPPLKEVQTMGAWGCTHEDGGSQHRSRVGKVLWRLPLPAPSEGLPRVH